MKRGEELSKQRKQKFTEKQLKFIEYYSENGNATQSAIMAGYSRKTAGAIGSENLTKPEIREAVEQKRRERADALQRQFLNDAISARSILFQVMQDPETPPKDKITAARDFLDRAGFKPVDKKEIDLDLETEINVNILGLDEDEK